jgi:methylmalonyl-CoA mutase N-terminal domain/subunit
VDPLGGSHLVEFLTDRMEAEIESVMGEIDAYGGVVKAIEDGWLQARLAERALQRKVDIDEKRTIVVGVNAFTQSGADQTSGEVFRLDPAAAQRVRDRFTALLDRRDGDAVAKALARLSEATTKDRENLLPYLVDCCHAYATVGEMVACMKQHWGDFQEPIRLSAKVRSSRP